MEKQVRKGSMRELSDPQADLQYWLTKSPAERVEAVEILRRQIHGDSARLQRVARVVRRV